jgi:hypothetical protein
MIIETKNATITSVDLDIERHLTMWMHLDYGGSGQGFGGYSLYSPKSWDEDNKNNKNFAGFFITRVLETVGVESFQKLKGQSVRVKSSHEGVHEIGHFLKDKWFNPKEEFERFKE